MAERQTRNVSLPAHQDAFVESMVRSGRYRTASEVVRDGLRLLEEAEHRRLLERWLYQGLDENELSALPAHVRERAQSYARDLVAQARREVDDGGVRDGAAAMRRLREEIVNRDE